MAVASKFLHFSLFFSSFLFSLFFFLLLFPILQPQPSKQVFHIHPLTMPRILLSRSLNDRKCTFEGCFKSAQSPTQFCVKHGGGKTCVTEGCIKVSRGTTSHCAGEDTERSPLLSSPLLFHFYSPLLLLPQAPYSIIDNLGVHYCLLSYRAWRRHEVQLQGMQQSRHVLE